MRVAVHGASGRMGRAVVAQCVQEGIEIVGAIEARESPFLGRDVGEVSGGDNLGVAIASDVTGGLLGADIIIDFSTAPAVPALLQAAIRAKVAIVSGTTLLDATAERLLDDLGKVAPVLWAPNMSLGVVVLAEITRQAVKMLGPGFDVEIVETHHNAKVDAPSGTANRLAEAVISARADLQTVHGRQGQVGARDKHELGMLAMRGGDVIGDHTVHLLGPGERIELTHRATSRTLFARGAVEAAKRLHQMKPGRYSMHDIVAAS